MRQSEFEALVNKVTAEEAIDLMKRAKNVFNEDGLADFRTVCAFLLTEIPQTSSAICKGIIEQSGLLVIFSEEQENLPR